MNIKSIAQVLKNYFEKPQILEVEPTLIYTPQISGEEHQPLSASEEKRLRENELSVTMSQNEELRVANQHNLDIMWRTQLLTLISILISILSAIAAILSVVIALS